MTIADDFVPIVDLAAFIQDPTSKEGVCQSIALSEALKSYSAVAIRDPRVSFEHNDAFITMLEDYFDQSLAIKMKDVRPEVFYQVCVWVSGQ